MIWRKGPRRSLNAVEYATLEWIDWYTKRRLLEPIGGIPPDEAEAAYYATTTEKQAVARSQIAAGITEGGHRPVLHITFRTRSSARSYVTWRCYFADTAAFTALAAVTSSLEETAVMAFDFSIASIFAM